MLGDESEGPLEESSGYQMASMLINPKAVYEFRIVSDIQNIQLSSGVALITVSWNPSGLSEWSSVTALFTEVRLVQARLHYAPYWIMDTNAITPSGVPILAIGTNLGVTTVSPSSSAAVFTLADSCFKPTSGWRDPWVFSGPRRPNSVWGYTSSPVAGGIDTGCYGGFQIYAERSSGSDFIGNFFIELIVEVRGRS